MANSDNQTQDIISRSDATQLVEFYFSSGENGFKYFKSHCHKSHIFESTPPSKIHQHILRIYNSIDALDTYGYFNDEDDCDYNLLNIDLPAGENTMYMLHHAVDNYIVKWYCEQGLKKPESIGEEMNDSFIEKNICAVCQTFRSGTFYFSTVFGLDLPVCSHCIRESEDDDTEDDESYSDKENEYDEEINHKETGLEEEFLQGTGGVGDEFPQEFPQEYKVGWNDGWKAAMQYIKTIAFDNYEGLHLY
jgi:hypothetical protein